jgi:hypothetical protein
MTGDRRRYSREACLISAHVRLGKRIYEGTILNVCEDGAFVVTGAPFDEDSAIQLRFRHPRTDGTVKARAVVCRRVRPGSGQPGLGLKLIDDLSSLEESGGAVSSKSGTWSRPEAVSHSGVWSRADLEREVTAPGATPTGDDISSSVQDGGRARAPRLPSLRVRVRLQTAGAPPGTGVVLDAAEGGFSIATDRPPRVGKLVRIDMDSHLGVRSPSLEVTGKVTWRRDEPGLDGSPRAFGIQILHFSGSQHRVRYEQYLAFLRQREANIIKVR